MPLDSVSEVTQLFLAMLAVILGAMVIGIRPSSRKSRSQTTAPSSVAKPEFQTERTAPTADEVLEGLKSLVAGLRRDAAADENSADSLALLKETVGQIEDAGVQDFAGKLFDIAQRLACLRYLIEHATGSDRVALGNMRIRTLQQLQRL